jgi:hypothetical protein
VCDYLVLIGTGVGWICFGFDELNDICGAQAAWIKLAEERFANIDVGGFAYWKNVESSYLIVP